MKTMEVEDVLSFLFSFYKKNIYKKEGIFEV
jgi:hypothetical protein